MVMSTYDVERVVSAFNEAKESGDYSQFEQFLVSQKQLTDDNYICDITWQIEDIQSIRPGWSEDKLLDAAHFVASGLQDRSTEEGWEILETLLDMFAAQEAA